VFDGRLVVEEITDQPSGMWQRRPGDPGRGPPGEGPRWPSRPAPQGGIEGGWGGGCPIWFDQSDRSSAVW